MTKKIELWNCILSGGWTTTYGSAGALGGQKPEELPQADAGKRMCSLKQRTQTCNCLPFGIGSFLQEVSRCHMSLNHEIYA